MSNQRFSEQLSNGLERWGDMFFGDIDYPIKKLRESRSFFPKALGMILQLSTMVVGVPLIIAILVLKYYTRTLYGVSQKEEIGAEISEGEISATTDRGSKIFHLLRCIRFLFPKRYREEWLGDLMEIVSTMETEKQPKWAIYTVVLSHFCIVV